MHPSRQEEHKAQVDPGHMHGTGPRIHDVQSRTHSLATAWSVVLWDGNGWLQPRNWIQGSQLRERRRHLSCHELLALVRRRPSNTAWVSAD